MNLIEVICWRCGRTTAQADDWTGLQLCLDCERMRAGLDDERWFTPIGAWHPTIARVLPGELAPVRAPAGAPEARPATHRVIVPMRPARDAELQRIPDVQKLIDLLTAAGSFWTRTTYAMAEEIATATLVESVALRFELIDGPAGVALWWDWRWHGAIIREVGKLTREHLQAVITGAPWPPPPVTCPRCGAEVRENADGSPRAHGPKRRCSGYWRSLMNCCWNAPITPSERFEA